MNAPVATHSPLSPREEIRPIPAQTPLHPWREKRTMLAERTQPSSEPPTSAVRTHSDIRDLATQEQTVLCIAAGDLTFLKHADTRLADLIPEGTQIILLPRAYAQEIVQRLSQIARSEHAPISIGSVNSVTSLQIRTMEPFYADRPEHASLGAIRQDIPAIRIDDPSSQTSIVYGSCDTIGLHGTLGMIFTGLFGTHAQSYILSLGSAPAY